MGIFDIFTTKNANTAADSQIAAANQAKTEANTAIDTGAAKADTTYSAGLAPFTTNLGVTQPGQQAYADATGAAGPEGYDRAVQSFHAGPGYDFMVKQATDAANRNAEATTGTTNQGGLQRDLAFQIGGMADQTWQSYIKNLLPFVGASTANASGEVPVINAQAGTQFNTGVQKAGVDYSTDTAIGNANASRALAGNNASGNIINAGMQGAKLAAGLIPFI